MSLVSSPENLFSVPLFLTAIASGITTTGNSAPCDLWMSLRHRFWANKCWASLQRGGVTIQALS